MFPTFFDMKNQFWAGLGSRAVLVKKKLGADEQILRKFFLCFQGQKKNWKYHSVRTKKLHRKKVKKKYFWGGEIVFFMFLSFFYRLKFECNLSVSTWRLGTSICSLICERHHINFPTIQTKIKVMWVQLLIAYFVILFKKGHKTYL